LVITTHKDLLLPRHHHTSSKELCCSRETDGRDLELEVPGVGGSGKALPALVFLYPSGPPPRPATPTAVDPSVSPPLTLDSTALEGERRREENDGLCPSLPKPTSSLPITQSLLVTWEHS
jgi:hypothetical protein